MNEDFDRVDSGPKRSTIPFAGCRPSTPPSCRNRKMKKPTGVVAFREIKMYRNSSEFLIGKLPFQRLVREIARHLRNDLRFESAALGALQEASEMFVLGFMEDANLCAKHAKRVTLRVDDIKIVKRLRCQDLFPDEKGVPVDSVPAFSLSIAQTS